MRSDNVESPIIVHHKNLSGDPSPKGGREERKGSEAATFPYLIRLYIEGHAFWTTASRLWSHAPHVMPASACVPTDSLHPSQRFACSAGSQGSRSYSEGELQACPGNAAGSGAAATNVVLIVLVFQRARRLSGRG